MNNLSCSTAVLGLSHITVETQNRALLTDISFYLRTCAVTLGSFQTFSIPSSTQQTSPCFIMDPEAQRKSVSDYYGKTLKTSADLKTSACCPIETGQHVPIVKKLHPEVTSRFYGCGSPIPEGLEGCTVLDLGCGTGRDVYIASALVGQNGKVIGVDMTEEQLEVAERYKDYHARTFFGDGAVSNVEFRRGIIEDLRAADIADDSIDVVVSNCVCNLSPDKKAVFSEVARVLKPGGEFYFSDVYADRRLSEEAKTNEVLVGECLGGALYIEDFRRVMAEVGLGDVRVVSAAPVLLNDPDLKPLVPDVSFYSLTIRAFSVPTLEDGREDYGQTATYTSCCGQGMKLDIDFDFKKRVTVPVDANTAAILSASRFKGQFTVTERGVHRGLFNMQRTNASVGPVIDSFRPKEQTSTPPAEQETGCCGPTTSNETSGCAPAEEATQNGTAGKGCC